MKTILLIIGILVAGSTFAHTPHNTPVNRVTRVVVVKKSRPAKKKVWIPGHWIRTKRGARVWVAGHWRRV